MGGSGCAPRRLMSPPAEAPVKHPSLPTLTTAAAAPDPRGAHMIRRCARRGCGHDRRRARRPRSRLHAPPMFSMARPAQLNLLPPRADFSIAARLRLRGFPGVAAVSKSVIKEIDVSRRPVTSKPPLFYRQRLAWGPIWCSPFPGLSIASPVEPVTRTIQAVRPPLRLASSYPSRSRRGKNAKKSRDHHI